MTKIDNDRIDTLYKEISEFGDFQPGIKYGYDFPEFALAMVGSKAFEHWQKRCLVEATLLPALLAASGLPQNPEEVQKMDKKEVQDKLLKISPYRAMLLKAMYLGYKLGKMENSEDYEHSKIQ